RHDPESPSPTDSPVRRCAESADRPAPTPPRGRRGCATGIHQADLGCVGARQGFVGLYRVPVQEAAAGVMKAAPFVYHAPSTVDEAVAVLAEVAPRDGRVLAGGPRLGAGLAVAPARPAPPGARHGAPRR